MDFRVLCDAESPSVHITFYEVGITQRLNRWEEETEGASGLPLYRVARAALALGFPKPNAAAFMACSSPLKNKTKQKTKIKTKQSKANQNQTP